MKGIHADVEAKVRQFGFTMVGVFGNADQPGFTYTIGLSKLGWPEIIIFSVNPEYAQAMITDLISHHKKLGTVPGPTKLDSPIDEFTNLPAHFIVADVIEAEKFAFQAKYFAEALSLERKYLQWVWPDRDGVFPWEADWDHSFDRAQPLLGEKPV